VVGVYDPLSFVSVDSIVTGGGTVCMTMDEEENVLYMVNAGKKTLVMSNLLSKKVVSEIDVGEEPYWVVVMGEK
jgi:hypothetical protein